MGSSLLVTTLILYHFIILNAVDNRPNFVLLFPDQWRFDWADQYFIHNLSVNTPTFDSIVKNGTRFIHTTVGSPLCAPSRACIAAGKEYDFTDVPSNNYDFPENETTFYSLLKNNSYYVIVSGKDDLTKETGVGINGTYRLQELGFNDQRRCLGKSGNNKYYPNLTNPFNVYLSQHYSLDVNGKNQTEQEITHWCHNHCCISDKACPQYTTVHNAAYEDNWITHNTKEMLDNISNNMPFYLQINWAGPHPPFIITEAMNKSVNNRSYAYPMNSTENPQDMQIVRRDYTAEIENLDKAFEKIIKTIRDLGKYDNTIFCVSSDHGEMLGDFNNWGKSKPWVASTNVPFVCMGPGIKKNHIVNTYVTNMDIAGTVMDYTQTPLLSDMTTVSLKPFLNGTWNDTNHEYRKYVSSGLGKWRTAVQQVNNTVTWKFVCCQGQCPDRNFTKNNGLVQLLFNIEQDMYEQNNIAQRYPDIVSEMKGLLPPNFCVEQPYDGYYDEKWSNMTGYQ